MNNELPEELLDSIFDTSDRDFEIFSKECIYWIKKFGLWNFEWFFVHLPIEDRACVEYNIENKIATVTLSTLWYNIPPSPKRIRKSAYHEVFEVVLGIVCNQFETEQNKHQLQGDIHTIIRMMENTQFIDDFNRRFVRKR